MRDEEKYKCPYCKELSSWLEISHSDSISHHWCGCPHCDKSTYSDEWEKVKEY